MLSLFNDIPYENVTRIMKIVGKKRYIIITDKKIRESVPVEDVIKHLKFVLKRLEEKK